MISQLVARLRGAGTEGPSVFWHWSGDVSGEVDFCVFALRRDGLRVPPFDRHAGGDGRLRALGLTEEGWRVWVAAVVAAQQAMQAQVARPDRLDDRTTLARLAKAATHAAAHCPGTDELRSLLREWWEARRPEAERWKREMTDRRRGAWMSGGVQRRLWRDLGPFHDRLMTIDVYLVDYPEAVVMALPPHAGLIAADRADRDGSRLAAQILSVARLLADRP